MLEVLRNREGERLDFTLQPGDGGRGIVVLGHGVTANKDRPFLTALAEGLGGAGLGSLRFSFSGNGESEGAFTESTISKEVAELGAVLDALLAHEPACQVLYVGHSQGGAVGVLRAAQDERIRGLVSLAGMVHCHAFAQRKFGDQQPDASLMWDKPECPLSQRYMDDMAAVGSVVDQAARVRVPWLLVHGDADTVVPRSDAHDAQMAAGGRSELVALAGADHVFTGAATEQMVAAVVPWCEARFEQLDED